MLFNSVQFAFFFAIVFMAYVGISRRGQNWLLLGASYIFYATWDWRFTGLLAASTFVDFYCARAIATTPSLARRQLYLGLSLLANLGTLGFFKYFNFFVDSAQQLGEMFGIYLSPQTLTIILPVGISFYTFQTLSYTIDVYRRQLAPTNSLRDFALYVAFFPQLVAGPIERATSLLRQIQQTRVVSDRMVWAGLALFARGLFKKVIVADNLAPLVNTLFASPPPYEGSEVLFGLYAFAFQIYGDFSGYTDMARGVAGCLGFKLVQNFAAPYFAANPKEFWQRWHISLSSWLRDYLYIPLGGSRRGTLKTYRNLAITMLLGGLWHGAAWTFVWWGAYHALLLAGHRFLEPFLKRVASLVPLSWRWVGTPLRIVCFFHLTSLGWLLFRGESMVQVVAMLRAMVSSLALTDTACIMMAFLGLLAVPLALFQFIQWQQRDYRWFLQLPLEARAIGGVVICFIILYLLLGQHVSLAANEFIYFQF